MMPTGSFRYIADIRIDLFLDRSADIDDTRDFRMPRVIVFLSHRARLESRRKLLRIIMHALRHPACRLHAMAQDVMIGILLVVSPGIVAEHRVYLQQTE